VFDVGADFASSVRVIVPPSGWQVFWPRLVLSIRNKKPNCCWEWADRTAVSGIAEQNADNGYSRRENFGGLHCSQYNVNLFARWHQRLWFKRRGVWRYRVGVWGWKLQNGVSGITSCSLVQTLALGVWFSHNAQRHRRTDDGTDGRTDRQTTSIIMPTADQTAVRRVRSATKLAPLLLYTDECYLRCLERRTKRFRDRRWLQRRLRRRHEKGSSATFYQAFSVLVLSRAKNNQAACQTDALTDNWHFLYSSLNHITLINEDGCGHRASTIICCWRWMYVGWYLSHSQWQHKTNYTALCSPRYRRNCEFVSRSYCMHHNVVCLSGNLSAMLRAGNWLRKNLGF